jgi:hypothetical protein
LLPARTSALAPLNPPPATYVDWDERPMRHQRLGDAAASDQMIHGCGC